MHGSLRIHRAPDLPPGPRAALVIATTRYADPQLRQLRAPTRDAEDFAAVLSDASIGGFAVTTVIDQEEAKVRREVARFLSGRDTDELVVVYLSCHGLLDSRSHLYFATADTEKTALSATAVESAWLMARLDECRARRRVLILDCCFSGAFDHGAKGPADMELERRVAGQGRGLAVLTASRASEYSFEGKPLPGRSEAGSVFTTGLVEGLRTGLADADGDGYVSLDEAYEFAYGHVRACDADQTPQRWLYGGEGASILLARNAKGMQISPTTLPEYLTASLDSPNPAVRLGGVATLAEWLSDPDPCRVLAAYHTLRTIAENDSPAVAKVARNHLDSYPELIPDQSLTTRVASETGEASLPAGRKTRRFIAVGAGGIIGVILAFLTSPLWPLRASTSEPHATLLNSCRSATLPESQTVTRKETESPQMYAVTSKWTRAGDGSAIAHGILAHGWVQQAFLATANQVTRVSVILSAPRTPDRPMPMAIQIRTIHGGTVASTERAYNGSTNNGRFGVHFENAHLRKGHVYILRLTNNSTGTIFVYTHYLDRAQVVPLTAAACEYNSGDDAGHQIVLHADFPAIQVLSGLIVGASS
jgi:Caspase domain